MNTPKVVCTEVGKPNITEFLELDLENQNDAWFDWFCKTSSLPAKTKNLVKKLAQLVKVNKNKFDPNDTYCFFKNNCPLVGSLYDDFRICDFDSGDVLYTVTPKDGHKVNGNKASVYGKENEFALPLAEGDWSDILTWFAS